MASNLASISQLLPVHFYCKELVVVAMAPLTMHSARTHVASKLMHGLLLYKVNFIYGSWSIICNLVDSNIWCQLDKCSLNQLLLFSISP